MFGRLMPREGKFFDYFAEHGEQLVLGARELRALMGNVGQLAERKRSIEKIEHRADKITQQTMQLLHATFITPLDRDEIHQLITRMDDILDLMEDVSQCMFLYGIDHVTDETAKLADICLLSCEKVKDAVTQLSNMKNGKTIMVLCKEIDQLESDADLPAARVGHGPLPGRGEHHRRHRARERLTPWISVSSSRWSSSRWPSTS
jgi:predicted phosphate transport protein (TIGR00153 family)